MPRTNTASDPSIFLVLPSGDVHISFPTPTSNGRTTLTIPSHSKFTTTLHWHETHVEYVRLLKGRARVTTDSLTKDYGPEDGTIQIDEYVRHEYMRADIDRQGSNPDEGDVVILEWTDPEDGLKEVMFRNGMSAFKDAGGKIRPGLIVQSVTFMAHLDNYPVLIPGFAEHYMAHAVLKVGSWLGYFCGMRWWYDEYTPPKLREMIADKKEA